MQLGDTPLILGMEWLKEAGPIIDWTDFKIMYKEDPIMGKYMEELENEDNCEQGKAATIEPGIPKEFQDYKDVFSEVLFKNLPPHRPYDCEIILKEDAELPKPARTYPMSPAESRAVKEYLDEELGDGKI